MDERAPKNNHEGRITSLEVEVPQLKEGQTQIIEELHQLRRDFREGLRDVQRDARKPTDWKLIIGALGLLAAVMTALGSMSLNPIRTDIDRTETALAALSSSFNSTFSEHEDIQGHSAMVARVSQLESRTDERFGRIDEKLNRAADAINRGQAHMGSIVNDTRQDLDLQPFPINPYLLYFQQ